MIAVYGIKNKKIKQLISSITTLTADEILSLEQAVKTRKSQLDSSILLQKKSESVKACPSCGSVSFRKFGIRSGKQRFKCNEKECGRTFTALSDTPFARLRHLDKHIENAKCMIQGLTVRDTAERVGVHRNTAFRWRHRFLTQIEILQPEMLGGIVEADETYFLQSFKGQRGKNKTKANLGRNPKTRGTPAEKRGLSDEQIPVLVVRDRGTGETLSKVIASRTANDLGNVIKPILAHDAELITDSATAYRSMAKKYRVSLKVVPRNKKHKTVGMLHINNVNAYDSRLKDWMIRFKGVATKYLPNYLGWHRLTDSQKKLQAKKFLSIAIG